jgi:hypothetical protein
VDRSQKCAFPFCASGRPQATGDPRPSSDTLHCALLLQGSIQICESCGIGGDSRGDSISPGELSARAAAAFFYYIFGPQASRAPPLTPHTARCSPRSGGLSRRLGGLELVGGSQGGNRGDSISRGALSPGANFYIFFRLPLGLPQPLLRSNISLRDHFNYMDGGERASSPLARLYLVRGSLHIVPETLNAPEASCANNPVDEKCYRLSRNALCYGVWHATAPL